MAHSDRNALPKWLPAQIAKAGIEGYEALARRSGLSRTAIYRYLNDEDRPSTQAAVRICRALGVPLEDMLRQYTMKPVGRPRGSGGGSSGDVKSVSARERKVKNEKGWK